MKKLKIKNTGEKTVRLLLRKKGFSKKAISEILKAGYLLDGSEQFHSLEIAENSILQIKIPEEELDYKPIKAKLNIDYEDCNLLVIEKPSGITVNSKGQISLANYLAYYFQENDIRSKVRFINRLDMGTSGLLMVGKNKYSQAFYQEEIEKNRVEKIYYALVEGRLEIDRQVRIKTGYSEDEKKYFVSDFGRENITYLKTIKACNEYSLISARLLTGKTHQIRLTCKSLGHPIVGDKLYGSKLDEERFYLHSTYLSFEVFLTGEKITLTSFPDFGDFLKNR